MYLQNPSGKDKYILDSFPILAADTARNTSFSNNKYCFSEKGNNVSQSEEI